MYFSMITISWVGTSKEKVYEVLQMSHRKTPAEPQAWRSPRLTALQEFADTSIPPLTSLYSVAVTCVLPLVLEDRSPVSSRASQLAALGQQTVFKSEHFTKCSSWLLLKI